MMVKVLIYSSKEIYDNASFEGRAEADIIAYSDFDYVPIYRIVKNRTSKYLGDKVLKDGMARILEWAEYDEWQRNMNSHKLKESYRNHPYTELMKNDV
jgi:hypothetical protein